MELPKYFYIRVRPKNMGTAVDLEDASDVDVVEVVRCKDCKWRGKHGCYRNRDSYTWYNRPKDDDFCSWGERREDETD